MPKLGDPTDFSYRISKVTKVVDGDTIDVIMDMGFDIMYKSRVRLFGIDTPESRTRNLDERKEDYSPKNIYRKHLKQETNYQSKLTRTMRQVSSEGYSVMYLLMASQ